MSQIDTYMIPYDLKNRIDLYEEIGDIPHLINALRSTNEPHEQLYIREAIEKLTEKTSKEVEDILKDFIPWHI